MPINRLYPGRCRHQFVIKYNSLTSTDLDSLGREQVTEATLATIKAEFKRLTGDERILANQQFGYATHELATWYVPGVTNQMWLIGLNGQRFNIVDIDDVDNKKRWLYMILASESS